eukprot:gene24564-29779_t
MLGASCTRYQQLGGGRMLAVAVALLATFTFPRLARGAKDDTMRVSWVPKDPDCKAQGYENWLNGDYHYRGVTVDGRSYYSRSIDAFMVDGTTYTTMYLYFHVFETKYDFDFEGKWAFDTRRPSLTEATNGGSGVDTANDDAEPKTETTSIAPNKATTTSAAVTATTQTAAKNITTTTTTSISTSTSTTTPTPTTTTTTTTTPATATATTSSDATLPTSSNSSMGNSNISNKTPLITPPTAHSADANIASTVAIIVALFVIALIAMLYYL